MVEKLADHKNERGPLVLLR